jgi:putative transposase
MKQSTHVAKTKDSTTRTFEYKIKPNKKFVAACEQALNASRFVYNCALEQRIRVYEASGKSIGFYEQSRQLTEARQEIPELKACLRTIQSDALERLDAAFDAFFRRLKNGEKPGFPRFKGRERYDTFSQKIEAQRACPLKGDKLTVPGVGFCRVRLSRPIEGRCKQLRITRRADGWYALLVCELAKPDPLPQTGQTVGVDVGLTHFATLSTGEKIENPRQLKQASGALTKYQRRLSKKKKGSKNRVKARQKVALRHLKVQRARKDFHHKTAADLVKRFDRIAVEDLNVKGLVKNHHLAQAISDVAWSQFFGILQSKAAEAGRQFERVNPRYTSQDCSGCGQRQKMPLAIRTYKCGQCGLIICRDVNAAHNILGASGPDENKSPWRRDSVSKKRERDGRNERRPSGAKRVA